MANEKEKGTWGGARPGAGRKKTCHKMIGIKVPQDIADYLAEKPNMSEYIKSMIREDIRKEQKHDLAYIEKPLDTAQGTFYPIGRVAPEMMPLADTAVAAGIPINADNQSYAEPIDIYTLIASRSARCVLLYVKGDSMIDANIMNGDIVGIDTSYAEVPSNKIALCELNGEYTIKYVHREDDGTVTLVPRNENFSPIHVSEGDDLHIRGMVTGYIHQFE